MRPPLPQLATDNRHPDHIAEVIETTTTEFLAQCLEPEELNFPFMPAFGSWVKAYDEETGNKIFGIVTFATTAPIEYIALELWGYLWLNCGNNSRRFSLC